MRRETRCATPSSLLEEWATNLLPRQADSAFCRSENAGFLCRSPTAFSNTTPSMELGSAFSPPLIALPVPSSPWHLRSNKVVNSSLFYSKCLPLLSKPTHTACSRE
ncbi:UNVERIFIED_CONTAM: hypothetical protein K2H54_022869 [Gekko kuhli]